MKTFPLISDAAHAWCRVPLKVLLDSGIADKISTSSYQKGNNVFLDSGLDLPKFVEARTTANQVTKFAPYTNKKRESRIRGYEAYNFTPGTSTSSPVTTTVTTATTTKSSKSRAAPGVTPTVSIVVATE